MLSIQIIASESILVKEFSQNSKDHLNKIQYAIKGYHISHTEM